MGTTGYRIRQFRLQVIETAVDATLDLYEIIENVGEEYVATITRSAPVDAAALTQAVERLHPLPVGHSPRT